MDITTFLRGAIKSKTVNFNVLLTIAIGIVVEKYHLPFTPEQTAMVTALVYGIINLALRSITGTSLPEKGLEVKLPKYTGLMVDKIVEIIEEKQPTKDELVKGVVDYLVERQRAGKSLIEKASNN